MNKNMITLAVIISALVLIGCKKKSESVEVDYQPGLVLKTSKDFLIPRQLRTHIEKQYLEYIRKENIALQQLSDEEILSRIPREFLDVSVYFRAEGPGTLIENTKFDLPRGGGVIDLKDTIVGKKGSFYLTFAAKHTNEPEKEIKNLHVYFFSQSKPKTIDKDLFGSPCGTFYEVTSMFQNRDTGGLHLNATNGRYVPVITGVFYFVDFDPERKIFLSAVSIEDSRYEADRCPPLADEEKR